jgi:hypothetical protein
MPAVLDAGHTVGAARRKESVAASGWRGKANAGKSVNVVVGIIARGAIGCVREVEEGEGAVVLEF